MLIASALLLSVARWVDPLLVSLVAFGAGLVLQRQRSLKSSRRAVVARWLLWGAWASLWLASTPVVVEAAVAAMEQPGPDLSKALEGADPSRTVIVVLGAGAQTDAEFGPPRERLNEAGVGRAVGAARIYHEHPAGLVVLSGGPARDAEATLDMITYLGVPGERVELEVRSSDTRENASFSAQILQAHGASRVVLVTSALHMSRSVAEFQRAGVDVIPAPVNFTQNAENRFESFFPRTTSLFRANFVVHELLGRLKP